MRGLRWLSGAEARELEPALHGEAALLSTVTGIIDSHALMLAYQGDLENAGGAVVLRAPVESAVVVERDGFVVRVGGAAPAELQGGRARQRRRPARAGAGAPIVGLDPAPSRGPGSPRATTSRSPAARRSRT